MKKELVAVVLAGGVGKRFWPLSCNKVLFPWFGKPFIEYSVKHVLPKEVSRVVIITNNENHSVISSQSFHIPSVTVIQPRALGMGDALLRAASELNDVALLILNGDELSDASMISEVVSKGRNSEAFGVIPGLKVDSYKSLGYLVVDGENVMDIIEKPGAGNEPSQFVAMLGHYIADSNILLEELKHTVSNQDDVYEKALSILMKRYHFVMQMHKGSFASLKYPWHVLDVNDELLRQLSSHRGKNVEIKSDVLIEGDVYIDDGVKIYEHTKIVGPCYIGKGTVIGNNNIIRQSHIGANCVTGFNTDITRSYVGDNCWFHSNYIGDSVLEENISLGSGAVLANLRLDDGEIHSFHQDEQVPSGRNKLGAIIGKNVRIGVNASIMPGIKIGKNTFIGSGVVIDKDIEDEMYCVVKNTYTILRNNHSGVLKERTEFKKQL
jgi:UDP-N-acetylglucosamine diphosphorylase / glucose-1-phosphate thymidylyltransferase / UDP-N-acetylgalactosamine diphosphorylase / glucosamine-1-phosphate N-acetyltransferase / galactosamine-1-phosphate N-acetyltransferase